ALGRTSEPIPDISVVPLSADDYAEEHPTSAILVVEISDTTLRFDETKKLGLYARHKIPEYWVLSLRDRTLKVYRRPAPAASGQFGFHYAEITIYPADQSISHPAAPEALIDVSELLPPVRNR